MSTSFEDVYESFFDKLENDIDFFNYFNVPEAQALDLAKSRSKSYIKESITKIMLTITPDVDFTDCDYDSEIFNFDLTDIEIDLIASIMLEMYLKKDVGKLKAMQTMYPSDINVFSKANERKSFLEMYKEIKNENTKLLEDYSSKNRLTNIKKAINYELYSEV